MARRPHADRSVVLFVAHPVGLPSGERWCLSFDHVGFGGALSRGHCSCDRAATEHGPQGRAQRRGSGRTSQVRPLHRR